MLRDEFVTTQKTRRTVLRKKSLPHNRQNIIVGCCFPLLLRHQQFFKKLLSLMQIRLWNGIFFFQTKQKKVASIRNKIITKEIGSKVILTQDLLPTFFYYVAFAKKCSRLYLVHISLFSFLPKRKFTILKIKPCVLLTFVSWRFPFQMLVFSSDNNNGFW